MQRGIKYVEMMGHPFLQGGIVAMKENKTFQVAEMYLNLFFTPGQM